MSETPMVVAVPAGWQVLDPDGNVAASGGQAVTEASADAGEET